MLASIPYIGTAFANLGCSADSGTVTPTTPDDVTPRLIALDWGTTSLRAWLMDASGGIIAVRRWARGLLNMDDLSAEERVREYEQVYSEVCDDWLRSWPGLPAIACGMVGSAGGWRDAGYLTVPTNLELGAQDLVPVEHPDGIVNLVPGLRIPSHQGAPGDVLRGEESQLLGAFDLVDHNVCALTFVLPGTHTKWVRVENRKIVSFTTAMTGELYGLLIRHGLLSRTAVPGRRDDRAFAAGLAAGDRGLLTELFGGRALVLDGVLDAASLPDYLSGVLIGDEIRHQLPLHSADRVVLCGEPDLCRRYEAALAGVPLSVVAEDATARGLWSIAQRAALLTPQPERHGGA